MNNPNPPAFPVIHTRADAEFPLETRFGMTLRDYFAAKAMQAQLRSATSCGETAAQFVDEATSRRKLSVRDYIAESSYRYADAMLAAREGGAK